MISFNIFDLTPKWYQNTVCVFTSILFLPIGVLLLILTIATTRPLSRLKGIPLQAYLATLLRPGYLFGLFSFFFILMILGFFKFWFRKFIPKKNN